MKSHRTRSLSLTRETLLNLTVSKGQAEPAITDVSCSTCDPRRPCCPQ